MRTMCHEKLCIYFHFTLTPAFCCSLCPLLAMKRGISERHSKIHRHNRVTRLSSEVTHIFFHPSPGRPLTLESKSEQGQHSPSSRKVNVLSSWYHFCHAKKNVKVFKNTKVKNLLLLIACSRKTGNGFYWGAERWWGQGGPEAWWGRGPQRHTACGEGFWGTVGRCEVLGWWSRHQYEHFSQQILINISSVLSNNKVRCLR